ncbi:hypothetical protein [Thermococcus prieurii]
MRQSPFVVLIIILVFPPLVAGATLKCPAKAPANGIVCRLEGNGRGKLYLKSVDGIPPRGYLITIKDSKGFRYSINDRWETFELPANVSFSPDGILGRIKDNYFDFVPDWVLFNKEHTFTFVFIGENGTRESFHVKVYIEGKPNWNSFKDDLKAFVFLYVILWIIFSLVSGIVWLADKRRNLYPLKAQMVLIMGAWIAGVAMALQFSQLFVFGLPYYYFGSGLKLWGDIVIGLNLWAITISIIFYTGNYFLMPLYLERMAYQKPLPELKKQTLGGCSGLVWSLITLALVSGALDSRVGSLLLIFLGIALSMLTYYILKTLKPEGVLFTNLTIAGFPSLKYRPDFAFVVFLVVLLFVVYFIQKKCLKRFTTEKERLIAEIEERVAKIEGAGR